MRICKDIFFFLFSLGLTPVLNAQQPLLERKLAYPDSTVYLPYTTLCFAKGAEVAPGKSGWIMDDDFQKNKRKSFLILEMQASDLLGQPYSGGSLQLIVELALFEKETVIDFGQSKTVSYLVNNYAEWETADPPKGKINVRETNGQIEITGEIMFTSHTKPTKQTARFKHNLIPVYDLNRFEQFCKEREEKRKAEGEIMVDAIVDQLMNDTTKSNDQRQQDELAETKALPGEEFLLTYTTVGLGSNRWHDERILIAVKGDKLSYGVMEPSSEIAAISYSTGDTTYKNKRVWHEVSFSTASRDSIVDLLDTLKGKYIFIDNIHILSGSITKMYIEYKGSCTDFFIKNAYHAVEDNIERILNPYLPDDYKLYVGSDPDFYKNQEEPLLKECNGNTERSYYNVLGDEYDVIRSRKK